MKLLSKYNRVNIIASIIALLVSSVCYYFILQYILTRQLDNDLKIEEQELINFVKEHHSLPEASTYKDQQISFAEINGNEKIKRRFLTAPVFNKKENEYEESRELIFPQTVSDKTFLVTISKSQAETEDLLQLIVLVTLVVILVLLLLLFLINRFLFHKLWHPFYSTLQQIKQFNLANKKHPQLSSTNITEFKELNEATKIMTDRVIQDYEALKSFTENASHEIQTPLAIIISKVEMLMQSTNIDEQQIQAVQAVLDATNRLSKLNQSLLFLTKIENRQFTENAPVDIKSLVEKTLQHYDEIIALKKITVVKDIQNSIPLSMNQMLAEILISNLITNTIKHNNYEGSINISLQNSELIIANTGDTLVADPSTLFGRFKNNNITSDSLGLGLSIVKSICELYNFSIEYRFAEGWHSVHVRF